MNVLLITLGSYGDVNPFVGLGAALMRRGHAVTLVTNPYFRGVVEDAGLQFTGLGTEEEYMEALSDPDLWHPHRALEKVIKSLILRSMREVYDIVRKRGLPDTVLVASSLMAGARIAGESLRLPLVTVDLQPSAILSAHKLPVSASVNLPKGTPLLIRKIFLGAVERFVLDPMIGPGINSFRAELGMPPVRNIFTRWLHSPQKTVGFFPDWFAEPAPDWPPHTTLAGFVLYDEAGDSSMPAEAEKFLEGGGKPIVFTPGTAMQHGHEFFKAAVDASRRLGRRAVLLTRHKEHLPAVLPDGVIYFDYLPFSRIFPRSAAVVHHGGIGTCAQALAAGVPQLLMPMAHDQPDNAARLVSIGVAAAVPPKRFNAASIAGELERLISSGEVQANCASYAKKIDTEKSLAAACEEIERAGMPGRASS